MSDVAGTTGLAEQAVTALRAQVRGELIKPGDSQYDQARKVHNAMIDIRPALIAQCRDVADVIHAVNFGREHNLDIAIRSGGHHGAGLSLVEIGGLTLGGGTGYITRT